LTNLSLSPSQAAFPKGGQMMVGHPRHSPLPTSPSQIPVR
jgi:hypothetical protein